MAGNAAGSEGNGYRKRAGDYILGLMDDAERERAERDLEVDAGFRDAVIELAESMHVFDRAPEAPSAQRWQAIAARLAELPQMQANLGGIRISKPVIDAPKRLVGIGLHALPSRRAVAIALGLIAAFALGYLAGKL